MNVKSLSFNNLYNEENITTATDVFSIFSKLSKVPKEDGINTVTSDASEITTDVHSLSTLEHSIDVLL